MAIAKVIYKESDSATGEVWMDTTQKTVTSGSMLSGTTALKNDGTGITGNIASKSSSDLTASGATVTAPAGYYASAASKSVTSGSAGTPTASKGTVSNHSVSVTPSVTNTTGYITGGTKTGTAVTVSASELVSGTKTISASGTTDVTNYASASVAAGTEGTPTATKSAVSNHSLTVTPSVTNTGGYIAGSTKTGTAVTVDVAELESGTKSITENGTGISVSGYSAVDVAVPTGGGSGLEYETGTWTPASDMTSYDILLANTHAEAPCFYVIFDNTNELSETTTSNYGTVYVNYHQMTGAIINVTSSLTRYGMVVFIYRGTSTTAIMNQFQNIEYPYTDQGSASVSYSRYWATETSIKAYQNGTRYWRTGRTYKWIAVWKPST